MMWQGWNEGTLYMGKFTKDVMHPQYYGSRRGAEVGPCKRWGEVKAWLLKLKSWCVLQDLVQNVWELIFTQVPIKWRVIYTNVNSILDVSCDSPWFLVNNGKTFRADWVSCGATMMGDGALRVLWDCPQKFYLIWLCIPQGSLYVAIWICRLLNSFVISCPCPWVPWGGFS